MLYHSGEDECNLETVGVEFDNGAEVVCEDGEWIDDSEFHMLTCSGCSGFGSTANVLFLVFLMNFTLTK